MAQTTILYRPVGRKEMDLIQDAGFRAFPPRLSWQPIFYPVLTEDYAIKIARDWNTKDAASDYVGYVTRFAVNSELLTKYDIQVVGGSEHQEYWIPSEGLDEFNANIVGTIEVIREFESIEGKMIEASKREGKSLEEYISTLEDASKWRS